MIVHPEITWKFCLEISIKETDLLYKINTSYIVYFIEDKLVQWGLV